MCGYIMIPKSAIADTRIGKPDIWVLIGMLISLSHDKGYCYASNTYLAKELRCETRTIIRWINALKQLGYVSVAYEKSEGGRVEQRRIYVKFSMVTQMSQGVTRLSQGGDTDVTSLVTRLSQGGDTDVTENNINIINNIIDNFNTSSKGEEAAEKKPLTDKIISALNKAAIMLTPTTADKLASWLGDLDEDVLVYAIEQADANGKRNAAYVEGILRRLHGEGIRTMAQVQQREAEHKSKKRFRDRDSSVYQVGDIDFDEIQRRMDEKY